MSRLNARLTRLEKAQGNSASSVRFIVFREVVCREGGELRSVPAYATVFNGTTWEQVAYHEGETEAAFEARVEAIANQGRERQGGGSKITYDG
jgi:hypothetical protein